MRREGLERRQRRDAEREAYLRAQLEPGETVIAAGHRSIVTDRRIILASLLHGPRPIRGETRDALRFDEITAWALGRRHDHRPVLRLEHTPHLRIEWVAAHRFLWFRWGNASGPITHRESTLPFNRDRDPDFRAIVEGLRVARVPQGQPFTISLSGTRQERTASTSYLMVIPTARFPRLLLRLRGFWQRLEERLYHGHVEWRVRLPSWLILAVPAWFIRPWLVLPAIVLAEVAWITGIQWSSRRTRIQRRTTP